MSLRGGMPAEPSSTSGPPATGQRVPTEGDWFRALADDAPVMLWAADAQGRRAYVNRLWLAFTGRTLDEELGEGWAEGLHPADAQRWLDAYRSAFAARQPFEIEYRLRRADGAWRCIRDTAAPRSRDGEFAGFAGSCVDVTEQRAADSMLREQAVRAAFGEELYRALAESVPAMVGTISATGEVQYCNRQLLEYCGYSLEGLRGARWAELIHPDDIREGRDAFMRRLQALRSFSAEYRLRRADGAWRWHLTRIAPLLDASGAVHTWVTVSVDVDDRHQAEEDVLRVTEEIQRASAAKDEFLGLVSHELRTPITTIYGNARVLRRMRGTLDPAAEEASIADIEQEALRLQQLVDNMFVLARMEAGEAIPTEPILLSRVVRDVVRRHLARYPQRQIRVEEKPGMEPAQGEPGYVEQVLRNLLSNAEKYSPAGETIVVSIGREDGHAAVRVLDGGAGIAEDELAHVFESFYRAPRVRDRAPGAGMGLAVCKRLVEAQGGRIWARPRDQGGTEVGFTLPFETEVTA